MTVEYLVLQFGGRCGLERDFCDGSHIHQCRAHISIALCFILTELNPNLNQDIFNLDHSSQCHKALGRLSRLFSKCAASSQPVPARRSAPGNGWMD